ncbi:Aromatic-L-amino-acid decarboxylase [Toxocara canis]|uniref:Aromatic-L-amino-acid decarboxylase n=1 Tax=Toxocara canis TaxID=6265 RepID=A0A0B2VF04_TOXCA|nr:Aromatic-L-amino-acid decarboxylase [Toxocara canis]
MRPCFFSVSRRKLLVAIFWFSALHVSKTLANKTFEEDIFGTVKILVHAGQNTQIVQNVLEYYKGLGSWDISLDHLSESDACKETKLANAISTALNTTLIVLISDKMVKPCAFDTARASVFQILNETTHTYIHPLIMGSPSADMVQSHSNGKDELLAGLDILTAAMMYFLRPLPDDTQQINEPPITKMVKPCAFDTARASVFQILNETTHTYIHPLIMGSPSADMVQSHSNGKDELLAGLDILTAAMMYFLRPLPDDTQQINEPPITRIIETFKKSYRKKQNGSEITIPIGWIIVVGCTGSVFIVLIVGAIVGQQLSQRRRLRKLKARCERSIRATSGSSARAAEVEPLIKQSEVKSGQAGSNEAVRNTQFTRYMNLVALFILNESKQKRSLEPGRTEEKLFEKRIEWNKEPDDLSELLEDLHNLILPSVSVCKRIRNHGALFGVPSLVDMIAETFCNSLEANHIIWEGCPLLVDLERVVVNWFGEAIGLPDSFLFTSKSSGGGFMLDISTESVLVAMVAARQHKLAGDPANSLNKMIAYASAEASPVFERAARLAEVNASAVECDENCRMDVKKFEKKIMSDVATGLHPFYVHVTIGTPSTGASDDLRAIADVASRYGMWIHVDAGYTCFALVCDQYKHLINGIEKANSISVNTHFNLAPTPTTSFLWTRQYSTVKDTGPFVTRLIMRTSGVASSYRRNQTSVASYKPLLKFIQFRIYGIEGILYRVRKVKEMTTRMRTTLSKDTRLELVGDSSLPIIAFKLKASHLLIGHESGQPSRSRKLCAFINATGEMLVSYAKSVGIDVIRITLTYENANPKYVDESCRLLTTLVTRFNENESKGETVSEAVCERFAQDVRVHGEQLAAFHHYSLRRVPCTEAVSESSRTGNGTSSEGSSE